MKRLIRYVSAALFLLGIAFVLSYYWKERTFLLLYYDVRGLFRDNRNREAILGCTVLLWGFLLLWREILGKIDISVHLHVRETRLPQCFRRPMGRKASLRASRLSRIAAVLVLGLTAAEGLGAIARLRAASPWPGAYLIGHSFGEIEGLRYTGAREAFEENYDKGYRVFEVDLMDTADGQVVLTHDWGHASEIQNQDWTEEPPTLQEFLESPIHGDMTPMSFEQLCGLMLEHPDIWIVTDTKHTQEEAVRREFESMLQAARNAGGAAG